MVEENLLKTQLLAKLELLGWMMEAEICDSVTCVNVLFDAGKSNGAYCHAPTMESLPPFS